MDDRSAWIRSGTRREVEGMTNNETEDSGMHLRGVYGSQTDFDVDEH